MRRTYSASSTHSSPRTDRLLVPLPRTASWQPLRCDLQEPVVHLLRHRQVASAKWTRVLTLRADHLTLTQAAGTGEFRTFPPCSSDSPLSGSISRTPEGNASTEPLQPTWHRPRTAPTHASLPAGARLCCAADLRRRQPESDGAGWPGVPLRLSADQRQIEQADNVRVGDDVGVDFSLSRVPSEYPVH